MNNQVFSENMHIGMRNLKTGLAVLACLLIYYFTDREGALIAAVSAIICMQDSIEKSLINGRDRLYGTGIGALLGMALLSVKQYVIQDHFGSDYFTILLAALGVMILILICNLLHRNDTIVIGCMVFLAIVLGETDRPAVVFSLNRLMDTFAGVAVAVAINQFVFNPAARRHGGVEAVDDHGEAASAIEAVGADEAVETAIAGKERDGADADGDTGIGVDIDAGAVETHTDEAHRDEARTDEASVSEAWVGFVEASASEAGTVGIEKANEAGEAGTETGGLFRSLFRKGKQKHE